MFPEGLQLIQGTVTAVDSADKRLHYQDAEGNQRAVAYDMLVMAVGSVVRQPDPEQGGIALTGVDAAADIRERWRANLRQAAVGSDADERQRLLTVAIAGAGISGIEASAELGYAMREEAERLGIDPSALRIYLVNAHERLFPQGPAKVGRKLEAALSDCNVTVLHRRKALHEQDGRVTLSDGETLPAGLCVWTLGLLPNPMLRTFGLPLTSCGQVVVDASYRVQDASGVYSIGDCAQVIDPASGRADGKTCKEAIAQAARLAQVMLADLGGRPAPAHQAHRELFCFGLGPEQNSSR
jgi:NADH dehydrogenase